MNFGPAKAPSDYQLASRQTAPALILFAAALIVRLLNIATLDEFFTEDSTLYWRIAGQLSQIFATAHGDTGEWTRSAERMPLYPLFIAAIQSWITPEPLAVVIVQSIVDSATVVMIAMLVSSLGPTIGIAAGVLAALWPNMVINSALVLTDTLFLFFFTACLLACLRFVRRPNAAAAAMIGILLGLALATRAAIQFLPPVFFLAVVFAAWRTGSSPKKAMICGVLFAVTVTLPVLPTLYRNYERFDRVFLTDQGSIHLLYWVLPSVRMHADGTTFDTAWSEVRRSFHDELKRKGVDRSTLASIKLRDLRQSFAIENLTNQPLSSIAIAWTQGGVLNLAAPAVLADQRMRGSRRDSLLGMTGGMIERTFVWYSSGPVLWQLFAGLGIAGAIIGNIAMVWGLIRLTIVRPWMAAAGAALIIYFLLLMGPVAAPKYRLPFAPVTIVLTAVGLVEFWLLLKNRVPLPWKGSSEKGKS